MHACLEIQDTVVRSCEEADIVQIHEIYAHSVRTGFASFEVDPPTIDEMLERREALIAGGFPYLVAVIEGRVVGYAHVGPYRLRPAYRHTVECSVYVSHRYHGVGIGASLLEALIRDAEGKGFRQMVAVIGDSRNLPSIRLHHRFGFTLLGTLRSVGWKRGRWLDTVMMQRSLGPGNSEPPNFYIVSEKD